MTWYHADYVYKLPMTSMQLRPVDELGYPGRTYKFFNGTTVYPFGHGLSYTQFDTTLVSARNSLEVELSKYQQCRGLRGMPDQYMSPCPALLVDDLSGITNETIDFEILVKNTGWRDGNHVLIVYEVPPDVYEEGFPSKQVVAFRRVAVKAGKSESVKFQLDVKSLSVVSDSAYRLVPSGEHTIQVGDGHGAVKFTVHVNFHH